MPKRRNYQRELDQLISSLSPDAPKPRLLLHVCCAPCSSYVLEYLAEIFEITVFYYNPNIGMFLVKKHQITGRIIRGYFVIRN